VAELAQRGLDIGVEIDVQWSDPDYWPSRLGAWRVWDERITELNERTGLLERCR
jgi:hypothetical protein